MNESGHKPVLLDEVLHGLAVHPAGTYVDCTFGRGGHAAAILARLGDQGRLVVFDRDPAAISAARARFGGDARVNCIHASFSRVAAEIRKLGVGPVQGILFDLGVSSPQLDNSDRGFSFQHDGLLDMRFDPGSGMAAADWLKRAPEREIAEVLKRFGEERRARRIARAIVQARAEAPLTRTGQLSELVASAAPARERHKHPATRTFQAIRIHVNAELDELMAALPEAMGILAPGGRLVVISFHSLEDRIVKRFMRDEARGVEGPRALPAAGPLRAPRLKIIVKATRPGAAELASNPRARSAVLRIAEKIAA